jgi:CheY-like chemotaxis protein
MKRVLVVDDRNDTLGFVRVALERAGYAVDVALNGEQALDLQRRIAADVLITDIFMPEMDGIEVIDRIKAEYPGTRVIAMSGGVAGMQDYLEVSKDIGADATLSKPFTTEELLRVLQTVL